MLKNITFLLKEKMESTDGISPEDTLIITDDLSLYRQYEKCGFALLYVDNSDEFAEGVKYVTDSAENLEWDYLDEVFCRQRGIPLRILETERTYVREMCETDIDALYELYDDELIGKYVEPLYEYEEELKYIRDYVHNRYEFYGFGMWLVFENTTDKLIGRAGIDIREVDGETEPELGYIIGKDYRRQGYATEICQAIAAYAKSHFGMRKLNIMIGKDNQPSMGLAHKLGAHKAFETDDIYGYILEIR